MISFHQDLCRKLKPNVITIDDQDQIIILDFGTILEEIENSTNFRCVAFVSRNPPGFGWPTPIDQSRSRITQDERREDSLAGVIIRVGQGYEKVERGCSLHETNGGAIDR